MVYINAKPQAKEYTISDGQGLYMVVTPDGSKLWDFRYRFGERRRTTEGQETVTPGSWPFSLPLFHSGGRRPPQPTPDPRRAGTVHGVSALSMEK